MRKIKLTKKFIELLKKYNYDPNRTQLTSHQIAQLCGHTNTDVTMSMYKNLIQK